LSSIFDSRTLIVAFEGWNDAAEGATLAATEIVKQIDGVALESIDPEEYYDFQFSRPIVKNIEDGKRELIWPTTELLGASPEVIQAFPRMANTFVLSGPEPSRRWRSFADEVMEFIEDREIETVIFLGAMLADVPHSRPIQVFKSSPFREVRELHDAEIPQYEGPVGILSIIAERLQMENIPFLSFWAAVPHYVHNAPAPKAALALIQAVEDVLQVGLDSSSLADQSFEWERGIDEVAEQDDEMANYIESLEQRRDSMETEQVSGDQIAFEFEKYLRQNKDRPDEGKGI
jgi:hypothetical protein